MSIATKLRTPATAAFIAMIAAAAPAVAGDNHEHHSQGHSGHVMSENMEMDAGMSMSDTVNGSIVELDRKARKLLLDHDAMPNIGMDAMEMSFAVADGVNLATLKQGQRVSFTVAMIAGAGLQITAIDSLQ